MKQRAGPSDLRYSHLQSGRELREIMKPKSPETEVAENDKERLVNDLEASTNKTAKELDSNLKTRETVIKRLYASLAENEDSKVEESNDSNVITDDYNSTEEGEVELSEDELTNVIHHSESDLDTYNYKKAYDDSRGPKDRNPVKPSNPDPPVRVKSTGNQEGTPIPGPSRPRSGQTKVPETPMKNKTQVEKPTKKRPSPIKYPESTNHGEDSNGEDVPLSRPPQISQDPSRGRTFNTN